MRALIVAGVRLNFTKVGPIHRTIVAEWPEAVPVRTGQHYDASMSEVFTLLPGAIRWDDHAGEHLVSALAEALVDSTEEVVV